MDERIEKNILMAGFNFEHKPDVMGRVCCIKGAALKLFCSLTELTFRRLLLKSLFLEISSSSTSHFVSTGSARLTFLAKNVQNVFI